MSQKQTVKSVIELFFNGGLAGHTSAAIAIILFLDTTKENIKLIANALTELDCDYYLENGVKYWVV